MKERDNLRDNTRGRERGRDKGKWSKRKTEGRKDREKGREMDLQPRQPGFGSTNFGLSAPASVQTLQSRW